MLTQAERLRILLVEDSPDDRLIVRDALERRGLPCEIVECASAGAALTRLETASAPFDLVVANLVLPDMPGLDFFRRMRSLDGAPPMVALVQEAALAMVAQALEEGVCGYLETASPIYGEVLPLVLENAGKRQKSHSLRIRPGKPPEGTHRSLEQEVMKQTSRLLRTNSRLRLEIRERKRLEDDLRHNEELFSLFMSRIPGMAFLKDDQGRFLFLNRYAEDVYGLSVAECTGKTAQEIWPGGVSAAIAESDRKVIESGIDIQEIERLQLEGWEVVFFTQKFLITLGNGARFIGGISLDITDYRRTEEKNRLLASAIQNSMESVFILDGEGAIQYLNPAAELSLSVSRRDLVGTCYERYLSRTPDTTMPLSLKKVQCKPWRGIIERSCGEETKRELDVIIAPVSASSGEVANYIVIEHDVTEERSLQHALERKRRVEALGMLAGGIAHDFINILQPILINAELASESLPEGSPERELLSQIIEAAKVGKDITNQIKMFGSRQKQVHKPVAIESMTRNALRIIAQSLRPGIELKQLIAPTSSLVRIAPAQFYQLLANLCINAVQAMDGAPGVLSVALSETEVSCPTPACVSILTPGEYLKITVTDTGCGMCPEVLDHIFDPLFTTRKSGKGTGLGLGVVHAVLKNAGGSVVVSSSPGEGATFEVYLPRYHAALGEKVQETTTQSLQMEGNRRGRVLLVDDNAPELKSIHRMLVRMGYRVASTSDSSKALHLFANTPRDFDLLITDQIMREMTGDQLAARVLEVRKDLPVIICSGSEDALDELKKRPSPAAVYLSKPFPSSLLAEAIGQAFRKATDHCP